eukprot:SM000003S11172  [mRNA]  locus=s3:1368310:1370902:- [translate_table: standard]
MLAPAAAACRSPQLSAAGPPRHSARYLRQAATWAAPRRRSLPKCRCRREEEPAGDGGRTGGLAEQPSPPSPSSSSSSSSTQPRAPSSAAAAAEGRGGGNGGTRAAARPVPKWLTDPHLYLPRRESLGERVLGALINTTAAPLGSYVAEPQTALHRLDPRVKQVRSPSGSAVGPRKIGRDAHVKGGRREKKVWLLALVVLPARAGLGVRAGLVALLAGLTAAALPRDLWQVISPPAALPSDVVLSLSTVCDDQLSRMAILCCYLFALVALGSDGVAPLVQARCPPPAADGLPALPPALGGGGGYKYVLLAAGPLHVTRRGVALAGSSACLTFTVRPLPPAQPALQSAALCLTTTPPEQLVASLAWFAAPLRAAGAPVGEAVLTLLLSLRFVGLVFDEARSLALGVAARGIAWRRLKLMGTLDGALPICQHLSRIKSKYVIGYRQLTVKLGIVLCAVFFLLFRRLFQNLFAHSDNISQAMLARGYGGDAERHRVHFLSRLGGLQPSDWAALAALAILVVLVASSDGPALAFR